MTTEPKPEFFDGIAFRRDPKAKTVAWFSEYGTIGVSRALLEEMKARARKDRTDLRICLHESPIATYHDMIILQHRENFYRPHKHLNKGETWHILEGRLTSFVFDDLGKVTDTCCLSPEGTFLFRISTGKYHMGIPVSDIVIYHESKPGPFLGPEDSIFPSWAPDGSDIELARQYRDSLLKRLSLK